MVTVLHPYLSDWGRSEVALTNECTYNELCGVYTLEEKLNLHRLQVRTMEGEARARCIFTEWHILHYGNS